MSGIMLNLVCDPDQGGKSRGGKSKGNRKHQRFIGRVRYLESQGLLNEKQNKMKYKNNDNKKTQDKKVQEKKIQPKMKKEPQKTQLNGGAVFPKFTSCPPNNSGEPSSSAQVISKKPTFSSAPCTSPLDPAHKVCRSVGPSKYLAIDCEMVGTGLKGSCSELARCSIVSYNGDTVYDKYVKPLNPVTDFRTRWSGIRKHDLFKAIPFDRAQKEIVQILTGKVVVGHAIHNDFKVLKYFHPPCQTRDTSYIPLLNQKAGMAEDKPVSLKKLTKEILKKDIQIGSKGHSSLEDAKATMELYKVVEKMWEQKISSQNLKAAAMNLAVTQTR